MNLIICFLEDDSSLDRKYLGNIRRFSEIILSKNQDSYKDMNFKNKMGRHRVSVLFNQTCFLK